MAGSFPHWGFTHILRQGYAVNTALLIIHYKPGFVKGVHKKFTLHNPVLYLIPWCSLPAVRVFFISIAMVIGPTPPGTGVI